MTVQTFIPSAVKAASENTVTQPMHTPDGSIKKLFIVFHRPFFNQNFFFYYFIIQF
mgnify:CR=1 FL=1